MAKKGSHRKVICFAHDSGIYICTALGLLALPSIFIGYLTKDMMVGVGSPFFGTAVFVNINNLNVFDAEFISSFYKTLPVSFSLFGFFFALFLYVNKSKLLFKMKTSMIGKKIYNFLNRKWFFDKIYNDVFSQFFFKFGFSISYKFIDRGIFEILGPTGLSSLALGVGSAFHKLHSGYIYHYNLVILIGITLLFGARQVSNVLCYRVDYRLLVILFVLYVFLISYPIDTKKL